MAENVLTKKVGPLPMWGWAAGGALLLVVVTSFRGASAAPNPNNGSRLSGNNGNAPSPNIFFLPNGSGANPGSKITINVNRLPGNGPNTGEGGALPVHKANPTPPPQRTVVTVKPWPGKSSNGLAEWDTTLWGIANHFGTTVAALAQANGISNPNLIYPGQQIVIP